MSVAGAFILSMTTREPEMADCEACGLVMAIAPGCTVDSILIDGELVRRIRYGGRMARCGDCGARRGHFHHPGCDMEPCPRRRRRQLITCDCRHRWLDQPDDEDDEDDEDDGEEYYPPLRLVR